jgi:2-keto-4-pentenoate hydratase/2-oxohepta-3-ene-1,7-dioic acid hydratase in catechol pathway
MRLLTYTSGPAGLPRVGVRVGHRVLDIESASRVEGQPLPPTLKALLTQGRGALSRVQALAKAAQSSAGRYSGAMVEERAIRFLPPVADAGRFVRVAHNFAAGKGSSKQQFVTQQMARLAGHNAKAVPRGEADSESYPELVYVVGRSMDNVAADDALDYVWGVTILGPGALGPEVVTLDEVGELEDLWITCSVNGEESVRWNARDQLWDPAQLLAEASRAGSLEPGDMVGSGAPPAAVSLKTGDVVECSIQGITTLRVTMGTAEST